MEITPAAMGALNKGDFENFIVASTPGGIEAQEAAGQQTFVNSETLPKEMLHGCTKEKLIGMGIEFKEDADDLFVNVILPCGWKKQATNHSMWSGLFDDKGRKRAAIFYKAAFYDRSAHIALNRRFNITNEPEDRYKSDMSYENRREGNWYGVVTDCDEIIFKTNPIKNPSYEQEDKLEQKAKEWLEEKYPNHLDLLAYWD